MTEASVLVPATDDPRAETFSVGRELARGYLELVASYRDAAGLSIAEAEAQASAPDANLAERVRTQAPDQTSWWELSRLFETDPDAGAAAWERLKAEAWRELTSGHRAARTLEWDGRPWERAQFLVLRAGFRAEWQPQGGIEEALIDTLAQAQTTYLHWMNRLHVLATGEGKVEDAKLKKEGYWQPPRLSVAESVEQAAAMADRFNRLFLRTLRALRDLRRYGGPVIVQQAGQVNVGGQQVNLVAPAPGTAPAGDRAPVSTIEG